MKYHVQNHALAFWKELVLQLDLEKDYFVKVGTNGPCIIFFLFKNMPVQCSWEKMGHVAPLQTVWGSRGTCSTRLDSIKITPHKNQTKKGPKYKSILIDKIHVITLMVPLSCPVSFIPITYTW